MLTIQETTMSTTDQRRRVGYRCEIEKFCEAVESLPPTKRILFRLYFQYGYPMSDIAKLCNVHEGTVSRKLRKIAQEVEEMLSRVADGGGS